MNPQRRCVKLDRSHKYAPFQARIYINGKPKHLGRFKTRGEAELACKMARKLFPAKGTTKPPLSDEKRASILATYERLQNGRATARDHGVFHETVQRIVRETPKAAALGRDPREPIGDCW
jgi:hypothetical protein